MKLRPIAAAFIATVSTAAFANGMGNQSQAEPSSSPSQVSEQSNAGSSSMQSQSSDTIKQVQEKLSQQGQNPGKADGVLGPKTQAALKDFQKQNNLQPSGQLDSETLAALSIDESNASTGSSASPSQDSSSGSSMSTPSSQDPSQPAPAGSTGSTSSK